ncbi:unnamed protein product [Diamesa hyperborea]
MQNVGKIYSSEYETDENDKNTTNTDNNFIAADSDEQNTTGNHSYSLEFDSSEDDNGGNSQKADELNDSPNEDEILDIWDLLPVDRPDEYQDNNMDQTSDEDEEEILYDDEYNSIDHNPITYFICPNDRGTTTRPAVAETTLKATTQQSTTLKAATQKPKTKLDSKTTQESTTQKATTQKATTKLDSKTTQESTTQKATTQTATTKLDTTTNQDLNNVADMNNKQIILFVLFVFIQNISKVNLIKHNKRSLKYLGDASDYEVDVNDLTPTDSDGKNGTAGIYPFLSDPDYEGYDEIISQESTNEVESEENPTEDQTIDTSKYYEEIPDYEIPDEDPKEYSITDEIPDYEIPEEVEDNYSNEYPTPDETPDYEGDDILPDYTQVDGVDQTSLNTSNAFILCKICTLSKTCCNKWLPTFHLCCQNSKQLNEEETPDESAPLIQGISTLCKLCTLIMPDRTTPETSTNPKKTTTRMTTKNSSRTTSSPTTTTTLKTTSSPMTTKNSITTKNLTPTTTNSPKTTTARQTSKVTTTKKPMTAKTTPKSANKATTKKPK